MEIFHCHVGLLEGILFVMKGSFTFIMFHRFSTGFSAGPQVIRAEYYTLKVQQFDPEKLLSALKGE